MKIKVALIGAILFFLGLVFIQKTQGEAYIANLHSTTPYSWYEIIQHLPKTIIFSIIAGLFLSFLHFQAKKNEEWRMNEARKRIAEREKQEKEAQEEKQKENKNNDDKQEKKSDNG